MTAIFTDISDLKQLQELQRRAERLEAVAALSASLAHEIRNPLASIRSSVRAARPRRARRRGRAVPGRPDRAGERPAEPAAERVPRLRAGAGHPVRAARPPRGGRPRPSGWSRRIPTAGPTPTIAVEGEADDARGRRGPAAPGGRQPGAQRGAGGAGTGHGHRHRRPRCSAGEIPPRRRSRARRSGSRSRGRRARDHPDEIRERLFEPFVSGRPGGSGLGLAIVQRAVEAHRGLVLVDSAPGAGTTFTIFLPAKCMAEDAA